MGKQRLHKVGYFGEMMSTNVDISDAVRPLLNLSRGIERSSVEPGTAAHDLRSGTEGNRLHLIVEAERRATPNEIRKLRKRV